MSDMLLSPKEVGDRLGVSERQVVRLGIPYVDLGTGTKRHKRAYLLADVEAWLRERRQVA